MSPQPTAEHDLKFSAVKQVAIHNRSTDAALFVSIECLTTGSSKRLHFVVNVRIHIFTNPLINNKTDGSAPYFKAKQKTGNVIACQILQTIHSALALYSSHY